MDGNVGGANNSHNPLQVHRVEEGGSKESIDKTEVGYDKHIFKLISNSENTVPMIATASTTITTASTNNGHVELNKHEFSEQAKSSQAANKNTPTEFSSPSTTEDGSSSGGGEEVKTNMQAETIDEQPRGSDRPIKRNSGI